MKSDCLYITLFDRQGMFSPMRAVEYYYEQKENTTGKCVYGYAASELILTARFMCRLYELVSEQVVNNDLLNTLFHSVH